MKKMLSIVLLMSILTGMFAGIVFAEDVSAQNTSKMRLRDEIIRGYKDALNELNFSTNRESARSSTQESYLEATAQIQQETVSALREAGFEAYDVNSQSFSNIEATLKTDLKDAGLNPAGQYIIIIEGEEIQRSTNPVETSASFTHTYNGTTYTLRWMTIHSSYDLLRRKATSVNLLESTSTNVITNVLDMGIYAYLSAYSDIANAIGVIGQICGISIADIYPASETVLDMQAATAWTQRYTQVWSADHSSWQNGCCVEEVSLNAQIFGYYYNRDTASYETVNASAPTITKYTSKFNNGTWRRDYAVIGYLAGQTQWDTTGAVDYDLENETIITHLHNF